MTEHPFAAELAAIRRAKQRNQPPKGKRDWVCQHPGCTAAVLSDSRTGVCRNHMHKTGCICNQCEDPDEVEIQ